MNIKNLLLVLLACTLSINVQAGGVKKSKRVVAAYVTPHHNDIPSANYVTHVNYAFGLIKRGTFDSVVIRRIDELKEMVALKEKNPKLKVILSIGGWTAGGFSEMASDEVKRNKFIADCAKKCEEFNLDGIDIDWEYPGSSAAGIKSSPDDRDNFTLLIKGLKETLGKKKLVTYASDAWGKHVNWKDVIKYLDFVNVMVYDMGRPPYHNAALYPSEMSRFSVQQAIQAHLDAGVPANKIVLGIPFYGHGAVKLGAEDYVGFDEVYHFDQYEHKWDSVAMVPYIVNKEGKMLVTYDDEESIKLKCEYALKMGVLGVMYWEYRYDDTDETLTRLTYETVMNH